MEKQFILSPHFNYMGRDYNILVIDEREKDTVGFQRYDCEIYVNPDTKLYSAELYFVAATGLDEKRICEYAMAQVEIELGQENNVLDDCSVFTNTENGYCQL